VSPAFAGDIGPELIFDPGDILVSGVLVFEGRVVADVRMRCPGAAPALSKIRRTHILIGPVYPSGCQMAGMPGMSTSDPKSPGSGTGLLTRTRPKTQRPPLYKVLLLNDDYTPMEFVVHVLERFFGIANSIQSCGMSLRIFLLQQACRCLRYI
jgi:hypothetical protein